LFVDEHPPHDTLNHFEHWWRLPVQGILFLFGLVNAGVGLSGVGIGTWMVLAAILVGKPIGILSATALSVAAGLHRPHGVSWRDLLVVGIIAGIGFTVALFFATAAFPPGPLLEQSKMGALLSISGGAMAVGIGRLWRESGADRA
jgi:NhaA family Na+:H+ antiporter